MGQKLSLHDKQFLFRRLSAAETECLSKLWLLLSENGYFSIARLSSYLSDRGFSNKWIDEILLLATHWIHVKSPSIFHNFLSFGALFISEDVECVTEVLHFLIMDQLGRTSKTKSKHASRAMLKVEVQKVYPF